MNNNQINCKAIYDRVLEQIKEDLKILPEVPTLTILAGCGGYASEMYMKLKQKTAEECGINSRIVYLPDNVSDVYDYIEQGDFCDSELSILQLPATKSQKEIQDMLVDYKDHIDVDNFNFLRWFYDVNAKYQSYDFFMRRLPATPKGVLEVLKQELVDFTGKKIAIIGCRSETVGKFLHYPLTQLNATVTTYHSKSIIRDGEFETYDAVISCVGSPRLIKQKHFGSNRNCICIDIGVSRVDGKTVGDFDEDIREFQRFTPYVNGMGLLTRIFLMQTVAYYAIDNYLS